MLLVKPERLDLLAEEMTEDARTASQRTLSPTRAASVTRRVLRQELGELELGERMLAHRFYRVAWPVPGQRRRTIDIAFTRLRLAVFIDGCFWHGCPQHLHLPRANGAWWVRTIETNRARDADVTAQLGSLGWTVMRFCEHEDPSAAAMTVRAWVSAHRS